MPAPSAIGEMQIKTTVRYPSAPITTARIKRRTKASVGEDAEKIGTLLGGRPVGTRDGTATPENSVAALQELKWRVTLWPGRPAQGLPERNENLSPHENLHAHVDGSMSHKSQKWEQPSDPPTDAQTAVCPTMGRYSATQARGAMVPLRRGG